MVVLLSAIKMLKISVTNKYVYDFLSYFRAKSCEANVASSSTYKNSS